MTRYRHLTPGETATLQQQGCRCADWNRVTVEEPFTPESYHNATFIGDVTLGTAGDTEAEAVAGIPLRCGIHDSVVAYCNIGREVCIRNVKGGLLNLDIADRVVISDTFSMVCRGESCFGNDVKVNVMSETGGREVCISDAMSAPLAYMTAFYRHNASLSKALAGIAESHAASRRSDRAKVGEGASIVGCGEIENVEIRPGARLHGVTRLVNGTVGAAEVGAGVMAEDFIIQDGAKVSSGARLHGCLAGHCAEVSAGFTAHDTLVCTNSRLENGESAAAFCGPFTTTMHKSTLLIGGLFSFFNAGSGTNQSNHLYKLGPMHQGILARGCKTGSDSYMMWPAAIGAFTTVTGRHYSHPDTRCLPFSYLIEKGGRSILLPGAAVASVGLARDVDKWPSRIDGAALADPVNFNWLSPYTAQSLLDGVDLLDGWGRNDNVSVDDTVIDGVRHVAYNGVAIPSSFIAKGADRYRLLLRLFLAGMFRRKILALVATHPEMTPEGLIDLLREQPSREGAGRWVDMAGMLAPREEVDALSRDIIANPGLTIEEVNSRIDSINQRYKSFSWSWAWHNLPKVAGHGFSTLTAQQLSAILSAGIEAATQLEKMWVADAAKEFDPAMGALGFGIDAGDDAAEIADDFSRARGSLSSQRFLAQLHRRVEVFTGSSRNIIALLGLSPQG